VALFDRGHVGKKGVGSGEWGGEYGWGIWVGNMGALTVVVV
jgi:hypothetical protein